MRVINGRAWWLAGLSTLLQVASFPIAGPLPYWRTALAWVALVPLLVAILGVTKNGDANSWKRGALLGYFCGVLWYVGNCYWIYQTMYLYGGLEKPVSVVILLLFALYLGLYHALFGGLVALVRTSRLGPGGALIAVPFLWVAVELARARVTGFPWDLLGNSQVDNLLLGRVAPVIGVMGMSFIVAGVNAGLAAGLLVKSRRGIVYATVALAVGVVLVGCGRLRLLQAADRAPATATVTMMQENLAVGATGRAVKSMSVAEELKVFTAASLAPEDEDSSGFIVRGAAAGKSDLIVWPEAPSRMQSNDPSVREAMGALATKAGVPVIAGSLGVDMDAAADRGYYLYDSASLFSETGKYEGRYDKIHLVPWGEYIPFKSFFSFAHKLTEGAGDTDPGRARNVFSAGGHRYGVFICYESIFGDEVREFVENGAEVLVNISDDGWYGDTGAPWQHLNMARMRAIENHRYLLRSTNTGVTTVIDPRGRIAAEAPRHVRGAFAFPFGYEEGTTFYTRHGDWWAYLCGLATLGFVASSLKWRNELR